MAETLADSIDAAASATGAEGEPLVDFCDEGSLALEAADDDITSVI